MAKMRLVHHKANGTTCLRTLDGVAEVASEIVVRLVYADKAMIIALQKAIRAELLSRGIDLEAE